MTLHRLRSCLARLALALLCAAPLAQAQTLEALFHKLVRRSIAQENLLQYETHMRLALKAQSQCRTTVESLAVIQQGPAIFAKQANIAHGHQQVNNGVDAPIATAPRAHGEKTNTPNKLLEDERGKRMDTGASGSAGGIDKVMAAVGKRHRATKR